MRAHRKKEGRKRNDKEQIEESDNLGYESGEDTEEEEYQTTDSKTDPEPEPETEVQRERKSKKKEDDSVIVTNPVQPQKGIPVQAEAESEPPKKKAKKSAIESDTNLVQPHMAIQATILPEHGSETEPPNKKTKTTAKEVDINPEHPRLDIPVQTSTIPEPEVEPEQAIQIGPQPQPEPNMNIGPQPQPESNIEGGTEPGTYFGPEPAELLDEYVAECERAEKIFEREREEGDAEIKACEEAEAQYKTTKGIGDAEIDLAIRKATEGVLPEGQKQESEAAPTLNKMGQHAPGLMMVASVAVESAGYDPSKAFDLRFTQPQPQEESAELYDLDDFPEELENQITPDVPPHVTEITRELKTGCVAWALTKKNDNKYNMFFEFNGEWHLEVPRSQFRTMRPGKEIDSGVITAYSLVLNNEPIPRFQNDSKVMNHFREDYIDIATNKVRSIDLFESDEHLSMVDNNKLITHRYWMYVLDKVKKNFFVIDSRPKEDPVPDRTKINKLAGNLINQLLVRAGYHSLLTKATKTKPEQRSWLLKYIKIHEQPNPFDCETFVMKWMEVLDPTKLAANKKYDIEDWTTEKLEEFRNEIISAIILSKSNKLIKGAIQGAMETTIHKPSAALQSPYVQVTTEELKKLG
ncbi:hypothetical protein PIB30_060392 [Stylosanthes scabra]|uniref:Ubiquitin-like protease family profile domain-containing protein n=1 Tax=Stylosanthes scabra TaxID=79078 RepID=A0ABU6WK62_9FABA|nr:hypothetical protein [Stylosanthes scabra]